MDAPLADLDRLVRADPSDRAARVRLLVALLRAGRVEDAWGVVRAGLTLDPADRALVGFHDDLVELTGGAFTLRLARDPQPCAIDPPPPIALRASPSPVVIGRHFTNAVIVHDPSVAPRPTAIELTRDAGLLLRDDRSGSRTVMGGRAVQAERLRDGDRFGPSQAMSDLFELRLDPGGADAATLLDRLERRLAHDGPIAWELLERGQVVGHLRLEGPLQLRCAARADVAAQVRRLLPEAPLLVSDAWLLVVDRFVTHGLRVATAGALEGQRGGPLPWSAWTLEPQRWNWFPEPLTVEGLIAATEAEDIIWTDRGAVALFAIGALGESLSLTREGADWALWQPGTQRGDHPFASEPVDAGGPLSRLAAVARARAAPG